MSILRVMDILAQKALPQRFLEDVNNKLRATNIALSGSEYCGISIMISLIAGGAIFGISFVFNFPLLPDIVYAIIALYGTLASLTMIVPIYLIQRRTSELENALPDALRQISASLKAGVSLEGALEDVAGSEHGALSEEIELMLAQVRRGRTMQRAMISMARKTRSELYERAFFLIEEGMERGATIADVLEAVSEDIRETQSIQRERQAATMQQVLFLLAAALFAAPLISGMVLNIGTAMTETTGGGVGGIGLFGSSTQGGLPSNIDIIIPIYILIQAAITGAAVGVIRYGKLSKGLTYSVPFMGVAIGVFFASRILVDTLFL